MDDLGGVTRREGVDRFALELDPADPVVAAVGDDLDLAAHVPREQVAAVLTQDNEPAAIVGGRQSQLAEQLDDARLVGVAVGRLAEDRVDGRLALEDGPARIPVGRVQRARPFEQVLDVVRGEAHASLQWRGCPWVASTLLGARAADCDVGHRGGDPAPASLPGVHVVPVYRPRSD